MLYLYRRFPPSRMLRMSFCLFVSLQEFPTKSGMQRHARDIHMLQEKSHKCEKCFKSFPSSQQLHQHMLVHNNLRKYKCNYCEKAFKQLSHVQQHHRRHTGESLNHYLTHYHRHTGESLLDQCTTLDIQVS